MKPTVGQSYGLGVSLCLRGKGERGGSDSCMRTWMGHSSAGTLFNVISLFCTSE